MPSHPPGPPDRRRRTRTKPPALFRPDAHPVSRFPAMHSVIENGCRSGYGCTLRVDLKTWVRVEVFAAARGEWLVDLFDARTKTRLSRSRRPGTRIEAAVSALKDFPLWHAMGRSVRILD